VGLRLGKVLTSTRGVIIWQGVEIRHNTAFIRNNPMQPIITNGIRLLPNVHSKKLLGCFNPNMGQIWTNPSVGFKNVIKNVQLKVKVEVGFKC